ncbi:DUF4870 domain-containing protein [Parabacteroides pacaensis]|uniref:DUF4870 domain-containing protein n=1 Tax=Parabacteroides pacaensis TaxID=2086575 RepID=UPI000D0EC20D|nr:DUF4870 domain-containing protein [Parabacteroides pacaensis]
MDLNKLEKLNRLYQEGVLTKEEFEKEKQRLEGEALSRDEELPLGLSSANYAALMNFALLFNTLGAIVSIIMWIAAKDKSGIVNIQGKYIVNWLITWFIAGIILFFFFFGSFMGGINAGMLLGLGVGALPLVLIGLCVIIFPIIGGVKCLNGDTWRYPLTIKFIK